MLDLASLPGYSEKNACASELLVFGRVLESQSPIQRFSRSLSVGGCDGWDGLVMRPLWVPAPINPWLAGRSVRVWLCYAGRLNSPQDLFP